MCDVQRTLVKWTDTQHLTINNDLDKIFNN